MATTTRYFVVAGTDVVDVRTKKALAVDSATALRKELNADVTVVTGAGTIVAEFKAPKKIKMSKPYTRVVQLPEDFEVPEGFRVCYHRPRRGLAVLHNFDEDYRLLNTKTGELLPEVYGTTRAAGQAMLTV